MTNEMITVTDLAVRYNNGHLAIYDINFSLPNKMICALIGINGSGKSTLFKSLMGLIKPQKGKVEICQLPINKALKSNLVSYVPQIEEVDWSFPVTVYDVVMMGRFGHMNFLRIPTKNDKVKVQNALEKMGISELQDRQIGELSGGQKKRVFLARALAQESRIFLLDEPFTGIDVTTSNIIISLLKELREMGKLILISMHNLNAIPNFCDHIIMLNRQLIAEGNIADTFTQENLQKVFGESHKKEHTNGAVIDKKYLWHMTSGEPSIA